MRITYFKSGLNYYDIEDCQILRDNLKKSYLKEKLKEKVLDKYQGFCGYCGLDLVSNNIEYEIHHIIPKIYQGDDKVSNLVCLCREPCHRTISNSVKSFENTNNHSFIEKYERKNSLYIFPEHKKLIAKRVLEK